MSRQSQMIGQMLRHGDTFTAYSVTGDACPCATSRDPNHRQYSAEWHRNNPDEDDCGGSLLVNTSTTAITLKGFLIPPDLSTQAARQLPEQLKTEIGERIDADLILYGQVNTSTSVFYDISGLTEPDDKITYDSTDYVIRRVFDTKFEAIIAQVSLLKRKS